MEKPAPTTYPIHDIVARRWSPRAFADRPVSALAVRSLLEAARWAPSSMNEQPWRFLVAPRDTDPDGHARLAACLYDGNRSWAEKAPLLMLSVASLAFARNGRPNGTASHDVGLAVAQLFTQATSLGLFGHQMGGFDSKRARADFDIPDDFEPIAILALGYPGGPDSLPDDLREREVAARQRRPHDDYAFGARWDRPLRTDADYDRLLWFWLGAIDGDGLANDAHRKRWFAKDDSFDAELRERFGAEHEAAVSGRREDWRHTPRGRLAYVILLDQLSRNMFRDTPGMFANDGKALEAARAGLERGDDRQLRTDERSFLFMPFMHSEDLADQKRCVELFKRLHAELDGRAKEAVANGLKYAEMHRDIIARFGRFPHRNSILGRESTAEEIEFLKQPGSSF